MGIFLLCLLLGGRLTHHHPQPTSNQQCVSSCETGAKAHCLIHEAEIYELPVCSPALKTCYCHKSDDYFCYLEFARTSSDLMRTKANQTGMEYKCKVSRTCRRSGVCPEYSQSQLGFIFQPGIIPVALLLPGKLNQPQNNVRSRLHQTSSGGGQKDRESDGKRLSPLIFLTFYYKLTNQKGELVLQQLRSTLS